MNVIFDMGGTIVENINASFERGFASIYPYTINANLSLNNFIDSTLQITFNMLKNREDSMLEVSFKDILEAINNTFLFNISVEKQEEIFVNNFEEIKVIEGVETFLKFLNEHSINCYILSNSTFSSEYLKMQLRKAGISKYFKACISSADVGYRKPHPYFFNYLINKYHLNISTTYMIGNDYNKDILGALNVGLKACFFNSDNVFIQNVNYYTFNKYDYLKHYILTNVNINL